MRKTYEDGIIDTLIYFRGVLFDSGDCGYLTNSEYREYSHKKIMEGFDTILENISNEKTKISKLYLKRMETDQRKPR